MSSVISCNLVVTKTRIDSFAGDALSKMGCNIITQPLLTILPIDWSAAAANLEKIDLVVVTSANAVCECDWFRRNTDLRYFVVGKTSARLLKEYGCINVVVVGNVSELVPLLESECSATNNLSVLYLRGEVVTHDLCDLLHRRCRFSEIVCYKSIYVDVIDDDLLLGIRGGKLFHIMLFSARAATNLLRLFDKYDLNNFLNNITLYCLSHKIADVCKARFHKVLVSDVSEESSLVELFERNVTI